MSRLESVIVDDEIKEFDLVLKSFMISKNNIKNKKVNQCTLI